MRDAPFGLVVRVAVLRLDAGTIYQESGSAKKIRGSSGG